MRPPAIASAVAVTLARTGNLRLPIARARSGFGRFEPDKMPCSLPLEMTLVSFAVLLLNKRIGGNRINFVRLDRVEVNLNFTTFRDRANRMVSNR